MLINLNLVIKVTLLLMYYPEPFDLDAGNQGVVTWITVEFGTFVAIIVANSVFMFTRAFTALSFQLHETPKIL